MKLYLFAIFCYFASMGYSHLLSAVNFLCFHVCSFEILDGRQLVILFHKFNFDLDGFTSNVLIRVLVTDAGF